jgi:hypothetical protein
MCCRGKEEDDKEEIVAVNVRCFNDVDLENLKVKKYDGASTGKPYTMRN